VIRNEELTFSAQHPGGRGQEGSIERPKRRAGDLPPKNLHLVSEDGDLDLLCGLARWRGARDETDHAAQEQVQK
jgi:hypothetical protein